MLLEGTQERLNPAARVEQVLAILREMRPEPNKTRAQRPRGHRGWLNIIPGRPVGLSTPLDPGELDSPTSDDESDEDVGEATGESSDNDDPSEINIHLYSIAGW